MFFFGNFFYITVLLINSVAILSEDRFLARSASPPLFLTSDMNSAVSNAVVPQ